jgi:hypothetical protein
MREPRRLAAPDLHIEPAHLEPVVAKPRLAEPSCPGLDEGPERRAAAAGQFALKRSVERIVRLPSWRACR